MVLWLSGFFPGVGECPLAVWLEVVPPEVVQWGVAQQAEGDHLQHLAGELLRPVLGLRLVGPRKGWRPHPPTNRALLLLLRAMKNM